MFAILRLLQATPVVHFLPENLTQNTSHKDLFLFFCPKMRDAEMPLKCKDTFYYAYYTRPRVFSLMFKVITL